MLFILDSFQVSTVLTVENMDLTKFSETKIIWKAIINMATKKIPNSTEGIELSYKLDQDGKSGQLSVDIKLLDTLQKDEIKRIIDDKPMFIAKLNSEISKANENMKVKDSTIAIITKTIGNFKNATIIFT